MRREKDEVKERGTVSENLLPQRTQRNTEKDREL